MKVLKQKQFSKDKAKEAGMVGGSIAAGLGSGLVLNKLAKDGNLILDDVAYKKVIENGKVTGFVSRKHGYKIAKKLRPVVNKAEKMSKTAGGKAVLIGVPTAAIGGITYLEAKKKDKKKDKNNKK